ncbi:MAG: lipid kinase [Bacteroidetes bacterium]|nr:MAG: lipid kinase [Bacteroidota bacterium]
MNSKDWITIVNPAAGRGKIAKDWPEISALLKQHRISFIPFFTRRRLHASVLAKRKIEEGYSRIIVVGGDGTMNEVINGVFAQKRIPTTEVMLGLISAGTGNDWAKMFDIPSDYSSAVRTIRNQKTFIQDAGLVSYRRNGKEWKRYFINIAGMGFDARVAERSNQLKTAGKSGAFVYFYSIFASLLNYKSKKAAVVIDDITYMRRIFSLNVGIGKYNGGGMLQVPHAVADDGLYSITLIKKVGKLNVLANVGRLYNGKITAHSKVETYKAKTVRIEGNKGIAVETDGESLGYGPARFQIIPASLKIIAGSKSA